MKAVSLVSGGIDSPVSSYVLLQQKVDLVLVHFATATSTPTAAHKIRQLAQVIKKQGNIKLLVVPFHDVQKDIIKHIPAKYRMITYRRMMFKIAEMIAQKEGATAVATGDSLGQVASQTLDNIAVIHQAATLPVLTPLLGWNKEDIVKLAREIGTYEISILPYEDCCTYLVARHPATRARLQDVTKMEQKLDASLLSTAAENAQEMKV